MEQEFGEETESEKIVFRELEFWQSFGQKTIDLNWCFKPKITTLFIAELYGQLGQLSGPF